MSNGFQYKLAIRVCNNRCAIFEAGVYEFNELALNFYFEYSIEYREHAIFIVLLTDACENTTA